MQKINPKSTLSILKETKELIEKEDKKDEREIDNLWRDYLEKRKEVKRYLTSKV